MGDDLRCRGSCYKVGKADQVCLCPHTTQPSYCDDSERTKALTECVLITIIIHTDLDNVSGNTQEQRQPFSLFPFYQRTWPSQHTAKSKGPLIMQKAQQCLAPRADWSPHYTTSLPTSTTMKLLIEALPIGFHFLILGRPIKKVSNCDYAASGSITLDARKVFFLEHTKNNFWSSMFLCKMKYKITL